MDDSAHLSGFHCLAQYGTFSCSELEAVVVEWSVGVRTYEYAVVVEWSVDVITDEYAVVVECGRNN